jgi:diguanylate cyclase (GGDEF)-like protein
MDRYPPWRRLRLRTRVRVGTKFFLMLALLVASLLATGVVGAVAQEKMRADATQLYAGNIVHMQRLTALTTSVREAGWTALQIVPTTDPDRLAKLSSLLFNEIVPAVDRQIAMLQQAAQTSDELAGGNQIGVDWQAFKSLLASPAFAATARGRTDEAGNDRLADQVVTALTALGNTVKSLQTTVATQAHRAYANIDDQYRSSRRQVVLIIAGALILGVGSVLLLIRNVVPRIRDYSQFAANVAAGQLSARLKPTGSDELSDLGRALNQMVDRRAAEHDYDSAQHELGAALQGIETEDEAHRLLKRHLERSIPGATAIVLNRNNSANRLQPTTALPADSPLVERLSGVGPRACLAVRLARPHEETAGGERLLPCPVCAGASSHCQPLLVGGEVIGAVLVQHPRLLEEDQRRIGESVMHAAPVLANLRNLAIAEHRALTDGLTGLPNQRASHDTTLRMVAQAGRAVHALAAVLLDLDHFKQINDVYGHDKGDEVLASVGAVLTAGLRASDFAGRYGGEEFLLLLPETDTQGALAVVEHLRLAISAITVPAVDRRITASFGIALLPDHAADAVTLLRKADRALYAAKAGGRNRAEVVTDPPVRPDADQDELSLDDAPDQPAGGLEVVR